MKNFFLKILSSHTNVNIPQAVLETFDKQFCNPLNVEWTKTDSGYEAIFYKDEMEHIANYEITGKLMSLKCNLPLNAVPVRIREITVTHGELMNAIVINCCREAARYELIVRDENLIRYLLLVNEDGMVLEKRKL